MFGMYNSPEKTGGLSVGGGGGKRECLVCLRFLPNRKVEGENDERNEENFNKVLDIFKVNLTPFNWNFHIESFPFCGNCSRGIYQIIDLHGRLEEIQNDIDKQIDGIRTKLRESEIAKTSGPTDVRAIIFRGQIIKNAPQVLPPVVTNTQQQSPDIPEVPLSKLSTLNSLNLNRNTHSKEHQEGSTDSQRNSMSSLGSSPRKIRISPTSQSQGFSQLCQSGPYGSPPPLVPKPTSSNPILESVVQTVEVSPDEFQNLINVKNLKTIYVEQDVAANEIVCEEDSYFQDSDRDYVPGPESENEYDKDVKMAKTQEHAVKQSKKSSSPRKMKSKSTKSEARPKRKRKSKPGRYKRPEGVKPKYTKGIRVPVITDSEGRQWIENVELKTIPGGYECGRCGLVFLETQKRFSKNNVRDHIRGVHLGLYKCDECNLSFTGSASLSLHNRREHVEGRKNCEICGKTLACRSMPWHLWLHMNAEEQAVAAAAGLKPKSSHSSHMCVSCGMIFRSLDILKRHEQLHTILPNERAIIPCPHCDGMYTTEKNLRLHIVRMHEGGLERKYSCSSCGKKFYSKSHLTSHKLTHLKKQELPSECLICGKRFTSTKAARSHKARVHKDGDVEENYKYPCEICGQRFPSKSSVQPHMRYHPEERLAQQLHRKKKTEIIPDFPCPEKEDEKNPTEGDNDGTENYLQPRRFNTAEDGQLSFRNINITPIKDGYQCGKCGENIINTNGNENRFIMDHITGFHFGNYHCKICQTYYKSKRALSGHLLTHKKIECKICGRPDLHPKFIDTHLWTHKNLEDRQALINTGEHWRLPFYVRRKLGIMGVKSWRCKLCDELFPSTLALEDHKKLVHHIGDSKRSRVRRKPCPRSKRLKLESETECEDMSFSDSDPEQESDSSVNRRIQPRRFRKTEIKEIESQSENSTTSVSLIRLPDAVLDGRDFKVQNDGRITFKNSHGTDSQLSVLDLDVGISLHDLRKAHFNMHLSSSDENNESEDGDSEASSDEEL